MGWRPLAVSVIGLAPGCAVSAVDLDNLDLNQATFQEKHADHPPIALDAFARVGRDALRAETAVMSEVGKAVRGGLFGTQNENFASGMETAAGVIAKKLVEHAGFCYFETIQQS